MSFIGGLSNEFSQRVVQRLLSKGCPMNVIGGLPNEFYRRLIQRIYIGGLSNGFFYWRFVQWVSKAKKIFYFENSFIHGKCMCGGVGEDLRHRAWHVDILVEISMFLLEWV